MTQKNLTNIAASVHSRLANKSKSTSRPFNELLQFFAIERFIYRLCQTPHADKFVLKGALMFSTWSPSIARPTMDIDFLGRLENSLDVVAAAMKDACRVTVPPDGMTFDPDSVAAARIKEDAEYEGVRVRLQARLGNARISIQIDVGFGDVVVPKPQRVRYPVLLDFPAPELRGYTMETAIAEKYQAMVYLRILNSRMKDFYDLWKLSRSFDFEGGILSEAISRTFKNRDTDVVPDPEVFDPTFAANPQKQTQWSSFLRKSQLSDASIEFESIVVDIKTFLEPVTIALAEKRSFDWKWTAPGPWSEK